MYPRLITIGKAESFFLFGPRGVGKTSWIRTNFPSAAYFDLLDSALYLEFQASPRRLDDLIPKGFDDWVVLDEVQRVPEILNEVHRLIENRRLKFILTGSSARKLRRSGINLLAGRAITRFMHPFTAQELGEDFKLNHALRYGLLPSIYAGLDPTPYLKSYTATYLREEVQQEGLTRNLGAFSRFLETATFSQGCQLNMASVARECGISRKVVEDYFVILEDLLLAARIPVFSRRARRRLTTHPKFFFFDAGVFVSMRPRGPLDIESEVFGASLETLLFQHLRALNDYHGWDYRIYFWRTGSGLEVDFVLYGARGLWAFEVKLADRLQQDDKAGLLQFLEDYPKSKAYLLYLGSREWHEKGIEIRNFEGFIKNLPGLL